MSNIKVRGGHRAMATKHIVAIQTLLAEEDSDVDKIKVYLDMLIKTRDKLLILDDEIQLALDDDKYIADLEESTNKQVIYNEQIIKVEKHLKLIDDSASQHSNESKLTNCTIPSNKNCSSRFRLPKLNLPVFRGDTLAFQGFWDIFESAVHNDTGLTDVQKFSYLKGQLRDEALKLLEGFNVTGSQYSEAVVLLHDTYGQTNYIVEGHILKLIRLKEPKATYDELSNFRATMECHVRGLVSLEIDVNCHSSSLILATILVNKLPQKIRADIERASTDDNWSLLSLRNALNREIKLLQNEEKEAKSKETPNKPNQNASEHKFKFKNKFNSYKPPDMTSNFNINTSEKRIPRCRLCASAHYPSECDLFKTIESRKQRVNNLKLCSRCLSDNHCTNDCKPKYPCYFCKGNHNTIFCNKRKQRSEQNKQKVESNQTCETSDQNIGASSISTLSNCSNNGVALPTATIKLKINSDIYISRALFDQGSQRTFLLKDFARHMKLKPTGRIRLSIHSFDNIGENKFYEIVNLDVITDSEIINIDAILVDNLPTSIRIPGISEATKTLRKLKIKLADPYINEDAITDVAIIIGSDHYPKFMCEDIALNNINLFNTKLGYMIWGSLPGYINSERNTVQTSIVSVLRIGIDSEFNSIKESNNSIKTDLDRIWNLDSIGINIHEKSLNEREVLNNFERNLKYENGHYIASLPWKQHHPYLPDNYGLAKARLFNNIKKLQQNIKMLECYNNILQEQLKLGFIEEVFPENEILPDSKIHYLPHHGVKKESETTPVRIVYDCSAGRVSLNDCLWSGPSMVVDLCKLLLRFRLNKYAICSDIEKAFLQISLAEKDRDSTRFLWLKNPHDLNSDLITYRFKVVLFGSTASQFLLNASIKHHLENSNSIFAPKILKDLYIDNLISTFEEEDSIQQYYFESNKVMGEAGLTLREWSSNSEIVRDLFIKDNKYAHNKIVKVLGMNWDTYEDTILYQSKTILNASTKRTILQTSACIFDPVGYLLPVTIRARIFLQLLWKCKFGWDQEISSELKAQWEKIAIDMHKALSFAIPRQLIFNQEVVLHAFNDASQKAYGSALYILSNNNSNLIIAKAKVAPVKELTIPKLELTSAVFSARLICYVKETFKSDLVFKEIHAWTDSQVVLQWLRSSRPQKQYIQNRIDEINKIIPEVEWHYISSKDNPSDILSRGITAAKFLDSKLWIKGPEWLNDQSKWPTWNINCDMPESDCDECINIIETKIELSEPLLIIENYSSLTKLHKITMLIFRFIKNLRRKNICRTKSIFRKEKLQHHFSSEELENSENYWIKLVQNEEYPDELKALKTKGSVISARIKTLNLFIENNILRCNRRLDNSSLTYSTKFPILLPNKHRFTQLVVEHNHSINHHVSTSHLITILRQKWWFPRMRQAIKGYIRPCVLCKRLQGTHYPAPPIPPLPRDRVMESKPFSITGVDYTGALMIKEKTEIRKVYIVLFTCAITRAVHLELVENNSKESFLHALRRFISRRSTPTKIYSDNATNFYATSEYFKNIQKLPSVQQFLSERKIEWKFIPARSPWFGGFWERLIGMTKIIIKKTLGRSLVSKEELQTVVAESELCLNTRPLTYVSDGLLDDDPLTPSSLIFGYNLNSIPSPKEYLDPDESYNSQSFMTKRHKYILKLIEKFWERWSSEYLTSLRQHSQRLGKPILKEGDIVLISDNCPRLKWRMGKIYKIHRGIDGNTRSVTLKTDSGYITRAITKLYPMEISSSDSNEHIDNDSISNSIRPKRNSAIKAREIIAHQQIINDNSD